MLMSTVARRTFLAALGLGPTTAFGVESVLDPSKEKDLPIVSGTKSPDKNIEMALRRMADMIARGEVETVSLGVNATVEAGSIVEHTITMKIVYTDGRKV
jgi:hypothetical protein